MVFLVYPQPQHLSNAPIGKQVLCPVNFSAANVQSPVDEVATDGMATDGMVFRKKPVDYRRVTVDHWHDRWISMDAWWMYWSECPRGAE